MKNSRVRRKKPQSQHLSISTTDKEWEEVREKASRSRKSIARYLVGLSMRNEQMNITDPAEQREALEILRRIDQYVGGEESRPLVDDLQVRISVIFDNWARGKIEDGCLEDLRESMAHVMGEESADKYIEFNYPGISEKQNAQPRIRKPGYWHRAITLIMGKKPQR